MKTFSAAMVDPGRCIIWYVISFFSSASVSFVFSNFLRREMRWLPSARNRAFGIGAEKKNSSIDFKLNLGSLGGPWGPPLDVLGVFLGVMFVLSVLS